MEKVLSVEEKIRRAEEIYNKRRGTAERPKTENIEFSPNSFVIRKLKKLFIQLSICIIVYVILYSTDFGRVIFSQESSDYVKNVLGTDIDFYGVYKNVGDYIQSIMPEKNTDINNDSNAENSNGVQENLVNDVNNTDTSNLEGDLESTAQVETPGELSENIDQDANSTTEDSSEIENELTENISEEINIGGAVEVEENNETTEAEQKTQMELDAEYVLSKVNFIKPLENYQISSRYGIRNPTTSTVPKNHKGIDLAAETGTKIVSATDGTVILASSQGDYGKHVKIQIDDIVIVYAHCDKLYVEEGQQISIGQEIAEVGSTGNSTGPHLHFEVRVENRIVDPEYILDFS